MIPDPGSGMSFKRITRRWFAFRLAVRWDAPAVPDLLVGDLRGFFRGLR
jgi:hypothetical protein